MIDEDPLFVDQQYCDYHLTYGSPCRNAAGREESEVLVTDMENDPRRFQFYPDMGADEFHNHLYCTGDFTPSGSIEGKIIGLPDTGPSVYSSV